MYAAGIDPTIVEVEQSAYSDCIVNGLIRISRRVKYFDIPRLDGNGILIYLTDKTEQSFFGIGKMRSLDVFQYAFDKLRAAQ